MKRAPPKESHGVGGGGISYSESTDRFVETSKLTRGELPHSKSSREAGID